MFFSCGTILINSLFQLYFFDYRDLFLMLKGIRSWNLRSRGIRSPIFIPSPGAFLPGAFFPGAFLPGRFGGHWFPERVRGHWLQENFGGGCYSSRWGLGRHLFPINLWRHSFPKKAGSVRSQPPFGGLCPLHQISFEMEMFNIKGHILVWCYFSGLFWKRWILQ